MVIVLISAWMPAPPPESEPAMTRTRAGFAVIAALRAPYGAKLSMRTVFLFEAQLRTKGSRRALYRLADVVDQPLYELRVVAFGHHSDQWLRAGLADDEAAPPFQFCLCGGDPLLNAVGLERSLATVEPDVLQQLRYWIEQVQHLA